MQKMDIKNYLFKKYFVSLHRDLSTLKYWKISPEQIYVKDKERISYEYNAFGERSHCYYGNAEVEKAKRPLLKHYSHDASVEIVCNKTDNSTKFVFIVPQQCSRLLMTVKNTYTYIAIIWEVSPLSPIT